jgi:hypothetical protein
MRFERGGLKRNWEDREMEEKLCKVFILHDFLDGWRRKESVAGSDDHLGGLEYFFLASFGGDSS